MKLLLFNHEYPPIGGGGGRVTERLAKEYAARGHEVHIVTSAYRDLPRLETQNGCRIERAPALRASPNSAKITEMLTYAASSARTAWRSAKKNRPDAVQVFFGIPSGGAAYLLKRRFRIPYVVFLGGRDVPRPNPDPPHYRHLYRALKPALLSIWKHASYVVACSEGLRELALQTAPRQPIEVIPDGIDLEMFSPAERPARTPVRALGVGRLIPRKGFDTFIRAAAELKKRAAPPFEAAVVGDGQERARLEALAEQLNVQDCVRFVGSVPYEELPKQYAEADIFALTSLAEGMPLAALEAMATGLPVVSTRAQGMTELIEDGVNGRLFEAGDHHRLAELLERLIHNPNLRRRYGNANAEKARAYAWGNIAEAYLELLEASAAGVKRGGNRK